MHNKPSYRACTHHHVYELTPSCSLVIKKALQCDGSVGTHLFLVVLMIHYSHMNSSQFNMCDVHACWTCMHKATSRIALFFCQTYHITSHKNTNSTCMDHQPYIYHTSYRSLHITSHHITSHHITPHYSHIIIILIRVHGQVQNSDTICRAFV
mgnify:FL=1